LSGFDGMLEIVPYADERHPVEDRTIKTGSDPATRVPPEVIVIPDSPAELCPELGPPPQVFAPTPTLQPKALPAEPPRATSEPEPAPSAQRSTRQRPAVGYATAATIIAAFGATLYGILWGLAWLIGTAAHWVVQIAPYVGLAVLVMGIAGWALGMRLPRGRQRSRYGTPRRSALARTGAVIGGTVHAGGVAARVGVIGVGALTRTVTRVAGGGSLRTPALDGVEIGRAVPGAPLMLRDQSGAPLSPVRRTATGAPVDSARAQLSELFVAERARRAERRAARQGAPAATGYAAYLPDGGAAPSYGQQEPMTFGARMLTRVFGPASAEVGQASALRPGRDPSIDWTFSEWLYAPGQPVIQRQITDVPTEWMTDNLTARWCDRLRSAWSSEQVHGQWSAGQRGAILWGECTPCQFCAVGFLFDESDPNGWAQDGSIYTHRDREKLFTRYGQEFLMSVSDLFEAGATPAQCADYVEQFFPRG
jgi:hypothetical protein